MIMATLPEATAVAVQGGNTAFDKFKVRTPDQATVAEYPGMFAQLAGQTLGDVIGTLSFTLQGG